jgi:hypothetical protein
MRKALFTTFTFPEDYRVEVSQNEVLNLTFTYEDMLLRSKKHNKPLLMYGDIDVLPINHILIDSGSSINLLPLGTLKMIGYSKGDLSKSKVVIHCFNQSRQVVGTISLVLKLDTLFPLVRPYMMDRGS